MANEEPLPTRHWEMIIVSIVFLVLGSFFTVWRLIIRRKVARWLGPSDWLMLLGVVCTELDVSAARDSLLTSMYRSSTMWIA